MTTVQTVLGPIDSHDLGLTLPHEHVLNDASAWWHPPLDGDPEGTELSRAPLSIEQLGRLRNDPFLSFDNTQMVDEATAVDELRAFEAVGGRTVFDMSCRGMGRDPRALVRIAQATRLQIVAGTGYYLQNAHPPEVAHQATEEIASLFVRELAEGCDDTDIRAGLVGEIGISKDFTPEEEKVLRAGARASHDARVPLFVHMPGWERLGHRTLDVIESERLPLTHVVLGHMNPSLSDVGYQRSLALRGAWLAFDMIGMDFFYADQAAQCPCDEENAAAIAAHVRSDLDRILLSGDVFLKMMLRRWGGLGYAHVPTSFAQRLKRHGLTDQAIWTLTVANPRALFETAAASNRSRQASRSRAAGGASGEEEERDG